MVQRKKRALQISLVIFILAWLGWIASLSPVAAQEDYLQLPDNNTNQALPHYNLPTDNPNQALPHYSLDEAEDETRFGWGTTQPPAEASCTASGAGGFSWLICEALDLISDTLESVEGKIYGWLEIAPSDYCGSGSDPTASECGYLEVWRTLRNVSTIAIIATALFMIIATALDFGFLSNYTIKKYLARLIVCTILIQLSWFLGDFLIQVTNEFGEFVGAIIAQPFGADSVVPAAKDLKLSDIWSRSSGATQALGGLAAPTGLLVVGFWAAQVGWLAVLLTFAIVLLMILIGFLFLILRKFLLIMFLVFSPFGLSLWVLPGDDKAWSFYWKSFRALLAIYPIIIAVFAFGRVFIWILLHASDSTAHIIAFIVYGAMFAAIPSVFKASLRVLDRIGIISNNLAKGPIDRLRKGRGTAAASRRKGQHLRAAQVDSKYKSTGSRRLMHILRGTSKASQSLIPTSKFNPTKMAQEAKDRKTIVDTLATKMQADRPFSTSNNLHLAQLLAPTSGASELEKEAALQVLGKRGQDQLVRNQYLQHKGNVQFDQSWQALADGGVLHSNFKDSAPDVAGNSIGERFDPQNPTNTGWGGRIGSLNIAKDFSPDTLKEWLLRVDPDVAAKTADNILTGSQMGPGVISFEKERILEEFLDDYTNPNPPNKPPSARP